MQDVQKNMQDVQKNIGKRFFFLFQKKVPGRPGTKAPGTRGPRSRDLTSPKVQGLENWKSPGT